MTPLVTLRAALEAATPGPWHHCCENGNGCGGVMVWRDPECERMVDTSARGDGSGDPPADDRDRADARLITLSRNLLPGILARLDAAEKERDELRAARRAYASEFQPGDDGEPDTGSIHANIRAIKSALASEHDLLNAERALRKQAESDRADWIKQAERVERETVERCATLLAKRAASLRESAGMGETVGEWRERRDAGDVMQKCAELIRALSTPSPPRPQPETTGHE
jgi:hypothetical protein